MLTYSAPWCIDRFARSCRAVSMQIDWCLCLKKSSYILMTIPLGYSVVVADSRHWAHVFHAVRHGHRSLWRVAAFGIRFPCIWPNFTIFTDDLCQAAEQPPGILAVWNNFGRRFHKRKMRWPSRTVMPGLGSHLVRIPSWTDGYCGRS